MASIGVLFQDYGIRELSSVNHELNRKRYYLIEVSPGLFGPILIRSWNRIGCKPRVLKNYCDSLDAALKEANRVYRLRQRNGYQDVTAFFENHRRVG
ncbi:WGR domain-containing protein [Pelobacter propionicus]|uniref:WGR domain-containing protein n=1 Tax=Pelobacter propionicus TaxID=29543 RepID=UPI00067424D8